jgi:hypothetical protein
LFLENDSLFFKMTNFEDKLISFSSKSNRVRVRVRVREG